MKLLKIKLSKAKQEVKLCAVKAYESSLLQGDVKVCVLQSGMFLDIEAQHV